MPKQLDKKEYPQAWHLHAAYVGRNIYGIVEHPGLWTLENTGGASIVAKCHRGFTGTFYRASDFEQRIAIAMEGKPRE